MRSTIPFLHALFDLLLAPVCLGCDGAIDPRADARLVCVRCRSRLRALPAPSCERCGAPRRVTGRSATEACAECTNWPDALTAARSACLLLAPADRLVHQLKYRGWPALAAPMAERMRSTRLPERMRDARLCVPVPTTDARQRERGYNQAALLAAAFANVTGRCVAHALVRGGAARSQTTLQPLARTANVAGAFRIRERSRPDMVGADVILVDDVLTTGATASECAAVLDGAGARTVSLITFARAIDARRLTQPDGAIDDDR
jgi:ComF family protein